MAEAPEMSWAGRRVGAWVLEQRLGQGAFGAAWLATDACGKRAVVKLLSAPPGDEIRALHRIHHPSVVRALDSGVDPVPHLVMDLAPGVSLDAVGALSTAQAIDIASALADALAACHQAGIAHGDLKPANVMVDGSRVTLVDFGLAGSVGGTPKYAAPERLQGEASSAAGDVYALGLLAAELFGLQLPTATERLLGAPIAFLDAPPPFSELLAEMLARDPTHRPTASAICDVLAANGHDAQPLGEHDLRQTAFALHVDRVDVDSTVIDWVLAGGSQRIAGPQGSGKSHLVRFAMRELQARGRRHLLLAAGGGVWGPIAGALVDPVLPGDPVPLPDAVDPVERTEAAAEALFRRAQGELTLVVDDLDQLDPQSRATIDVLERLGVPVLATMTEPDPAALVLHSWGAASVHKLITGLLGAVDSAVLDLICAAAGEPASPLRATAVVLGAVRSGALVYRRRTWVADPAAFDSLVVDQQVPLSPLQRDLVAAIAAMQPVSRDVALAIAQAAEQDLDVVVSLGLVRAAASLYATGARPDAGPGVYRRVIDHLVSCFPVPFDRLGDALVGADEIGPAEAYGADCVRVMLGRDVTRAVTLAQSLWLLAPTPELAALRVDALVKAGRVAEAREAGQAFLGDAAPTETQVPVLLALGALEDGASEDAEAMMAWLQRAVAACPVETPALTLALARAHFRGGDHRASAAACRKLCAGEPTEGQLASWRSARGLLAQALATSEGAAAGLAVLHDLPPHDHTAESALLEGIRGRLLWHAGRPREAAKAMEIAASAKRALSIIDRARLENNAALCWFTAGDIDRAVAGFERALLGFERASATLEAARVLVNLCQGFRELGRWQRAEEAGFRAANLAADLGDRHIEAVALGNLGDVSMGQRRYTKATVRYDLAERILREECLEVELCELARRRAELAAFRADPDLRERAELALSLATKTKQPTEVARSRALLAVAQAQVGDAAGVRDGATEAVQELREQGAAGELAIVRLWLAEAWLVLNEKGIAAELAQQALRYASEFGRPPLRSWADRLLALSRHGSAGLHKLERLTELAVRVSLHTELDDLLDKLAQAAVEIIDADRALVVLYDGGEPRIVARAGSEDASPPSMSIVRRAISTGREVVSTDLEERSDLRDQQSVVAMQIRAAFCVPLMVEGTVVGALYLDSQRTSGDAVSEAVVLLRALAAHASVAVRNARLTAAIQRQADQGREIAHDLRNPLSGIALMAEDAAEGGPPLTSADAAMILDAARHALDLVARCLDPIDEALGSFDWSHKVNQWCATLTAHARNKGVELLAVCEIAGTVLGRASELQRAFVNVASNAIKYTPRGGTVVVRTLVDGKRLGVEVRDEGPGIDPVDQARLFDRGYQGRDALPGHGLGLAIVRQIIVDGHGGEVTVNSTAGGRGAIFTLWVDAG